jgi:hypothetical protein
VIIAAIIVAFLVLCIVRVGTRAEREAREPYTPTARDLRRARRRWNKERIELNPSFGRARRRAAAASKAR